jgi:hypothetical protein
VWIVKMPANIIQYFLRLDHQTFCCISGTTCWEKYWELDFLHLVNASRRWSPEMDQIIEIMRFSLPIVVMGGSATSSLDAAQIPYHNGETRKRTTSCSDQEIHKLRCLTILKYFKKVIWHDNSWGFHILFEVNWCETHRRWDSLSPSSREEIWDMSLSRL